MGSLQAASAWNSRLEGTQTSARQAWRIVKNRLAPNTAQTICRELPPCAHGVFARGGVSESLTIGKGVCRDAVFISPQAWPYYCNAAQENV